MIIEGRRVYPMGIKERGGLIVDRGEVVVSPSPVSFLGGVDPQTGIITDGEAKGKSIAGKVFVFPEGRGSTVGSYVMYGLKRYGNAPLAVVNRRSEIIVTVGAIISGIPLLDRVDTSLFLDGDILSIRVDGSMELHDVDVKDAVTVILRSREKILILKRSDKVGSCRGRWAGVSGHVEDEDGSFSARGITEVKEETGMQANIVREGPVLDIRDTCGEKRRIWRIHPFLADVSSQDADRMRIDWEHTEYRWIRPEELDSYHTVPGLADVVKLLLT